MRAPAFTLPAFWAAVEAGGSVPWRALVAGLRDQVVYFSFYACRLRTIGSIHQTDLENSRTAQTLSATVTKTVSR